MAQAEEKATEKIEAVKEDFNTKLEEVSEKATTKARESIVEAIGGKEEKWVPKSYEEITKKAEENTMAKVDEKLAERDKKVAEEAKRTQDAAVKRDDDWDKIWDKQLDDIAAIDDNFKLSEETTKFMEGKSVRSLSPAEVKDLSESDEGFSNRAKLEREATANGKRDLELYYYKEFKNKKSGTTAPVITGSKAVTATDSGDFDYMDHHGKKPSELIAETME